MVFGPCRHSTVFTIANRLINDGVKVVFFEPYCSDAELSGMQRIDDLETFKASSDLIVANRMSDELEDVRDKVFTRDVFNVD